MRPESGAKIAPFPSSADHKSDVAPAFIADPLNAFASENDPIDERQPALPTPPSAPSSWRRVGVLLLILACVAQAALLGYWYWAARAGAATGALAITSDPTGLPVVIDGTARGTTPLTVTLAAGSHTLDVGAPGRARTQPVTITGGGDASVHVTLPDAPPPMAAPPTTGALEVSTDTAGARIWVNGELRGTTPTTVADLPPGPHTIRVASTAGGVTRTVTIEAGKTASLAVSLAGGGQFASGYLAVTSAIPLQILENGTLLGSTDTPRLLMAAGRHDLEFANVALGFSASHSVQITPGQTAAVALEIPRGTLHVNALPWAEVFIDGRAAGETPLGNLSLPLGSHEIVFRHPELGERRRTVVIGLKAPARIGVDFRREPQ